MIGSHHSSNLKQLGLRAPKTDKDYEMQVYRRLEEPTQANLSEFTRCLRDIKVTNKGIF